MSKKVFIYRNNKDLSVSTHSELTAILNRKGYEVLRDYSADADLLICIGGDGTLLSFVHKYDFPSVPIMGINTGHLGFFQDATPENMEALLDEFESGKAYIQRITPIDATITTENEVYRRTGLNELLLRGPISNVSHYSVYIGETKIQDISGDGVLVSTPVGSTAYNYSLNGSVVAPDLGVLQLTPIAPLSTNAYRCLHSSVIIPADQKITICGINRSANGYLMLSFDGRTHEFNNVIKTEIVESDRVISLVRVSDYDYWKKINSKLV